MKPSRIKRHRNTLVAESENVVILPAVKWIIEHFIAASSESAVATMWKKVEEKQNQTVAYGFICGKFENINLKKNLFESDVFGIESEIQNRIVIDLLKNKIDSENESDYNSDLKLLKLAYSIARKSTRFKDKNS